MSDRQLSASAHAAIDQLHAQASRPFEDSYSMPAAVYTAPDFLELEQERIFNRQWLCVGRSSTLSQTGDYLSCDIGTQPVAIIREQDGSLRAMSNVCRHRMVVLLEGRGNTRAIVCPYHAWSYRLDGELVGAPLMEKQPGFCKGDHNLPNVRCEEWGGWIYITLDNSLPPVAEQFAELDALIGHYGMENYHETFHEEHVWNTNWKVLAENFMESYHLPMLHRGTVGPHSRPDEMECPPGHAAFNYHWITKEATLALGNAHPNNIRLEGHWRKTTALLCLYPTHLITLTPGYFWYLVLQPRGVDKVHIRFGGGLAPEFIDDPDAAAHMTALKALLDEVNLEDRRGVEAVFRGLLAPLARPGRLSHLERPNYDFARYVAKQVGAL